MKSFRPLSFRETTSTTGVALRPCFMTARAGVCHQQPASPCSVACGIWCASGNPRLGVRFGESSVSRASHGGTKMALMVPMGPRARPGSLGGRKGFDPPGFTHGHWTARFRPPGGRIRASGFVHAMAHLRASLSVLFPRHVGCELGVVCLDPLAVERRGSSPLRGFPSPRVCDLTPRL